MKNSMGMNEVDREITCIEDGEISPDTFNEVADGCLVSDQKSDRTSMSWRVECKSPQGSMKGDAKFTSTGSAVTGLMNMKMEGGGMDMSFEHRTEGKRLGDCE